MAPPSLGTVVCETNGGAPHGQPRAGNYGDSARRVGRRVPEVAERRRVADQPEVPVRIEEAALPVRPPRRFVVPYGIAAAVRARLDSPRDEAVGVVDETSTRTVVVPMSVGL